MGTGKRDAVEWWIDGTAEELGDNLCRNILDVLAPIGHNRLADGLLEFFEEQQQDAQLKALFVER